MTSLSDLEVRADAPPSEMAALFARHGAVVVRDVVAADEITRFRGALLALISAALAQRGVRIGPDHDLDEAYRQLIAADPDASLALRGLGKDLREYHRFLANESLGRVLQALIGSEHFQINYDQCLFRIDRPTEEKFAFDWHQDYPYNLLSRSAVTVWAPLTEITSDVGPMRIVPGSHDRLFPVIVDRSFENMNFAKHNTISLADQERLAEGFEASSVVVTDIHPGDVVFMHSLLVHRSGQNQSNRCRWVINPRFGDFLDPQMVTRRWRTARAKSPFIVEEIHPEAVLPPSRGASS